ncbi:hypothetical protein TCAL_06057 [Tigriopus californicus]|uniref:Uncharacterized protein n=1 Tax=Tigriopus californicus TaxID=6832 RepID=A0A553PPQ3_TIGCA|nr:rab-like protein 6 [Tigriopus californicus]TRY79659.1 hypothetical protein TCAL_06057 [Tigriopus californicus]|eukprot:TCALIF_06057-PA protein Name:"Similar to RABL6 Rab-like protein 6 (Homo sapiens)" AED:0.04 eAED:0.04 QI:0/-1/0/1/-1/1/1/0/417
MITAWKKLTTRSPEPGHGEANGGGAWTPPAVKGGGSPLAHATSPLNSQLQQKFARGVDCNLQIVIRGDHGTGKTVLWQRLQGQGFQSAHQPTHEIQVASIHWNHKASDDIVKVDVWDVVDRGKKRKVQVDALKFDRTGGAAADATAATAAVCDASLDAEFLDVYKGTHGAVFMLNVGKPWTFDYVKREVPKVPQGIPILIMANFTDLVDQRCIATDEIRIWMEAESSAGRTLCLTECSLLNGLGLRYLHKFFSLPYLTLQRRYLEQQLATNQDEIRAMKFELETCAPGCSNRAQELHASVNLPPVVVVPDGDPKVNIEPGKVEPPRDEGRGQSPTVESHVRSSETLVSTPGLVRRSSVPDVDDFIPIETKNSIDTFLSDENGLRSEASPTAALEESEDEEEDGNPMVAKVQEDVHSD